MKLHILAIIAAAALVESAAAQMPPPPNQDPCKVLAVGGTFSSISGIPGCVVQPQFGFPNGQPSFTARDQELNLMLSARMASELRALIGELQGLRKEMYDYKVALAQAKAGFEQASKDATSSQETWRKTALEQTLKDVERIPSRLATDNGLRQALLTMIKEDLPKDSTFLQAVREATKP